MQETYPERFLKFVIDQAKTSTFLDNLALSPFELQLCVCDLVLQETGRHGQHSTIDILVPEDFMHIHYILLSHFVPVGCHFERISSL